MRHAAHDDDLLRRGLVLAALLLLVAFAFAVRLWPLQVSHWWDEALYLQHAEVLFSGRRNYDEFYLRPPLLPVLIAGAFAVRHDVLAAGVLTAALGAAGVVALFLLGREAYDRRTGLLAAAMLAVSPFFITASHWIMNDVPSLTLVTAGFWFLVRGERSNRVPEYLLAGICFGLAVLMRFMSLILVFALPAWWLASRSRWRRLPLVALGGLLPLLPYLAWARTAYGSALFPFRRANAVLADEPTGDAWYYHAVFDQVYPAVVSLGLVLLLVRLVTGVRAGAWRPPEDDEHAPRMDWGLLAWLAVFWVYVSLGPHREPRYLVPAGLPLFLLAARGLTWGLAHFAPPVRLATAAAAFLLTLPLARAAAARLEPPLVDRSETEAVRVSRALAGGARPGDVVYANHDYPVLAYYSALPIRVVPWDRSFYAQVGAMREPGFLVVFPATGKEPTTGWLDQDARFSRVSTGEEIVVYRYAP